MAVILVMAVIMAVSVPALAQAKAAPDTIILKGNPMGGVKFMHAEHAKTRGIKCDTCHHPSKPEKPSKVATEACSDCHTKTATAPMKTNFKGAFHDAMAKKGTCIDCHTAENAKGKKAPTKCMECHQKANV
jgi:Na+-translocating ferredoxin:NAD+ oxidoreductase RnfC subunit